MGAAAAIWCIGIDPGYGMTGLVLLDPAGELCAQDTMSRKPGELEVIRAMNMRAQVISTIDRWLDELVPPDVDVRFGVETPVYTGNALTFSKQWRLVQEVEAGLVRRLLIFGRRLELAEIVPSTSKKVLTGNGAADKQEMIDASPFAGRTDISRDCLEALADAYGHALAARVARDIHELRR